MPGSESDIVALIFLLLSVSCAHVTAPLGQKVNLDHLIFTESPKRMFETKNHGPDKGDNSPGRWEGCCCRAPGAAVNTAEFRRNAPRENKNVASRQLNFALHLHVGEFQ